MCNFPDSCYLPGFEDRFFWMKRDWSVEEYYSQNRLKEDVRGGKESQLQKKGFGGT